jgi:hypothetical protein
MMEKYTNVLLIDEQFQGPNLVYFLKESAKLNLYFPNKFDWKQLFHLRQILKLTFDQFIPNVPA